MDPHKANKHISVRKPNLTKMPFPENAHAIDFLLQFLPVDYMKTEFLHKLNERGRASSENWHDVTFTELIHVFAIMLSMEVTKLPNRRMYWETDDDGMFKAANYGRYMSRKRHEDALAHLVGDDDEILNLISAFNENCKEIMSPGEYLVLDESMVKSFHRNLKGKMKIIRKPRPIGNEFKNLCDGHTQIVLFLELYEGKELMQDKEHVSEYGATSATCLRLTEPWKHSGRIVIADSWFGSVKSAVKLYNINGLYSNMLVKTAHKNYPRLILGSPKRGEWFSATAKIDEVNLLAVKFMDLKEKQFVSTCSSSATGPPRVTKHCGLIQRPQVAFDYLRYAAGIDIHNHVRTGSLGLEDVWMTKSPLQRQLAGIVGFIFTNSYLAMKYFGNNKDMKHVDFKKALANQMIVYDEVERREKRRSKNADKILTNADKIQNMSGQHTLKKYPGKREQKPCFYCQHGRSYPVKQKTCYECVECDVPICPPTLRDCWQNHVVSMPKKRRLVKEK